MLSRRRFVSAIPASAALHWLPSATAGKTQLIERGMQSLIDANEIHGVVTLVTTPAGITHFLAQGYTEVARQTPMRKDTIFAIASMSKPVTGCAVMMMQDEGKLSVDDPVAKYIPELGKLKLDDGSPANITLKHMMTHTSGMAEATDAEIDTAKTLSDLIPLFASKTVGFSPGSRWKYCQSGINSLCRVVEVVSGMGFADFLDKRLFGPMGMKDTGFYPSAKQMARLVKPCKKVDGKLVEDFPPPLTHKYIARRDRPAMGNGKLFSNAEDYSKFARMLLNGGEWKGKRYLSSAAVKQMTTMYTGDLKAGFVPGSAWGLTVGIVREPVGVTAMLSPGTFGHGGAYGTQAWIDPVKGVALILMIQRVGNPDGDASAMRRVFQEAAMA